MVRKSLLALTSLLVCISTLVGCSTNQKVVSQQSNDNSLTEPGTFPISKSGSKLLTIATTDNLYAPKSYTQNLPVFQEIQSKTGVQVSWQVQPASQYFQAMKVRLAAGQNLPDIINLPLDPVDAANQGLIIPLDDLITKFAPHIKKVFDQNPDLYKKMKSPDGKLYALKSIQDNVANPYGILIRKDWLDKLNLQEPRTPDDWFNVFKAFKDQNVNGKGNVIPFSPGDDEQLHGLWIFGSAFDMHLIFGYSSGFYPDQNGNIQFEWLEPKGKDFITWLHKLYANGLIDPQFLANGDPQTLSEITRNLVGATQHFMNNTIRYSNAQKQAGVDADWELALPPASVGGKGYYEKTLPLSGGGGFSISKDCKDPELAIRWLDYIFATQEGNMYVTFGIQGKSYNLVDGKPQFTDWVAHNPDGLSFEEALRSLGALPVLPTIRGQVPPFDQEPLVALKMNPALEKQQERVKSYLVPSIYFGSPTKDESEQVAKIWVDINTYMDQTLAQFITGQKPIDWNQFTNGLKSMGIDKVIKVRQKQYDRYK